MKQILTFALLVSALMLTKNWENQPAEVEVKKPTVACVPCGNEY